MGITYNPRIVTDGLVLALDAANPKSYPGSGTTWTDLSGNRKNGTLTNGPTYNNSNLGSIVLNRASSQYAIASNSYSSPSLPTGTAQRTVICCFKTASSFSGFAYEHILHYGNAGDNQAYGIAIWNNSGTYYIANHTWAGNVYFTNQTASTNTVYFVAVTYNHSATPRHGTFFVNGTFGTIGYGQGKVADYTILTGTGDQLSLGSRVGLAEYFSGEIYFAQVYNRVLTAAEVSQNFNALRGRYGI